MQRLAPGEIAPFSGEYNVLSKGRIAGTIHVNKGDRMPPTQSAEDWFEFNQNN